MPEREKKASDTEAAKKLEEWAASSSARLALEEAAERADERARTLSEQRRIDAAVLDEPCTV